MIYKWKICCIKIATTSGKETLKAYGFDAANQMSSSMGMTDGIIQKAVYQYNGLGHRMGQSITTGDAAPARTIRYTLDLTRQYHNLLQKTGNGPDQLLGWQCCRNGRGRKRLLLLPG